MEIPMGRIVAIAGGDLKTTHKINQYIVALTKKENPNFLFIGTASCDAEEYISNIYDEFEPLGCSVKELNIATKRYSENEIDYLLNHADIIYVGGGDTAFMMETWKKYRLDRKLKNLYLTDQAVLSGISAGAMCWFNCGHSDSSVFWNDDTVGYGWVNGLLDIFPYVFCPHYDERVEIFDEMMQERTIPGLALESNVAFVENGGCVSFVASDDSSKAYIIRCVEGNLRKQEQKIIYL
jgi:dipeptidase E